MSRDYYVSLIGSRPQLMSAVLRFNAQSPRQEDGQEPTALQSAALRCPALASVWPPRPRHTGPFFSFEEESERLALFSAEELGRLGRLAAAAVFSETIRKTLRRDDVLAVRSFLGLEGYAYATGLGRFQAGSLALPLAALTDRNAPLSERCAALAAMLLSAIRAAWPAPFQDRTAPLFSQINLTHADALTVLDPALRQRLWQFLKKILHREFAQSWANYFD